MTPLDRITRIVFAATLLYEATAILSRRAPTLTSLHSRYPMVGTAVKLAIDVHLGRAARHVVQGVVGQ